MTNIDDQLTFFGDKWNWTMSGVFVKGPVRILTLPYELFNFITGEKMNQMKGKNQTYTADIANSQHINNSLKEQIAPADLIKTDCYSEILYSEGNESFEHYIEWLGLSHDTKLIVLSSIHHYYYDAEEIMNVKTVINLRELNQIKEISTFLHSMFLVLPPRCCLIGCFVENKKQKPLLNTIFNLLESKTNKYLSGKHVIQLLRNNGFMVMDMTELNGLTYFCAQSQRMAAN